jgi:hypothetical protein
VLERIRLVTFSEDNADDDLGGSLSLGRWVHSSTGACSLRCGAATRWPPYHYRRQRHTTVVVRAPRSFVDKALWPEYLQIKDALNQYLNEATERIIREEVYSDSAEAPEGTG